MGSSSLSAQEAPHQLDDNGGGGVDSRGGIDPGDLCAQEAPAAKKQRPPDPLPRNPSCYPQTEGSGGHLGPRFPIRGGSNRLAVMGLLPYIMGMGYPRTTTSCRFALFSVGYCHLRVPLLRGIHGGHHPGATGGSITLGGGDITAFFFCRTALQAFRLRSPNEARGPLPCHRPFISFCPRHWLPPCPRGVCSAGGVTARLAGSTCGGSQLGLHGQQGERQANATPGGMPEGLPASPDSGGRLSTEVRLVDDLGLPCSGLQAADRTPQGTATFPSSPGGAQTI